MELLDEVIFYHIEKAIKSYRQYAQMRIRTAGINITIDQWLVLMVVRDEPDIQLKELAAKVFKDNASITRIIVLLEKNHYLNKTVHKEDGRRIVLSITKKGKKVMEQVSKIVRQNREHALRGISDINIASSIKTLKRIASNCVEKSE